MSEDYASHPEYQEPLDHLILKGGYWYRPNKRGYTKDVIDAGRYTKADAEREAAIEPWHMEAVPIARIETPTKSDAAWVEDAVRNAKPRHRGRRKHPRWVAVMDTFGCGSGYANALCRRFGFNPDEEVRP